MNRRNLFFGIASMLWCASVGSEPSPPTLELRIDHVSRTGQIAVNMHNTGQAPLRLWRAGRWDVAPWRVLHISASSGMLNTYYQNPNQIFNDSPLYLEVSPGKPRKVELDLTDGWWLPHPKDRGGDMTWATGDTLIAIYDIESSADAQKHGVWSGVVAAKAVVE